MQTRELTFPWEGIELAGTLHLPDGNGPHPVLVMLQGSGPADRDGDGYFLEIRAKLIDVGVGTFAFDKPGCGISTGDWRDYSLMDRARQAEAAIHFITGQTGVDPTLVGVWGQSQGGWIVQILAGRVPELPFAVANSGPSIGVAEQDRYGLEHTMRAAGFSDEHIDAALALLNDGTVAVASGMPFEEAQETLIGQAAGEPWEAYLTLEDSRDWELFRRFVVEGYDPHQSLRSIKCPFLAIYGAKDVLLPAWQSAHETGQCLVESGARDAAVVVFPAGNHRIQDDETGEFVEGYLDLLAAWVSRRAKRLDAEPAVLC